MAKRTNKDIILGSGKVYLREYNGTMPAVDAICVDQYLLGYIKGGATLTYSETTYEEKDDLGYVRKIITTDEEAKLKLGLITWNGATLQNLVDRCGVTEADGIRTTKIGGAGNAQGKNYVVCFHHEDQTDGDIWVMIEGRNTAGLSLAWSTGAGTIAEPEFTAMPHDSDGTLIEYIEQITDITPTVTMVPTTKSMTVGDEDDISVTIAPASVAALVENKVSWSAHAATEGTVILGGSHTDECHVKAVSASITTVTASIVYAGRTYSADCVITISNA